MKASLTAATVAACLVTPAMAKEPSGDAKMALYCMAALAFVELTEAKQGNKAAAAAVSVPMKRLTERARSLLTREGFSEAEMQTLVKTYSDKAYDDFTQDRPRAYTEQQCRDASNK
jgi:hypothetical protein